MTAETLNTVLILGANGRFGRNAANAFADAGWTVLSHTRIGSQLSSDVAGIHTPFDILDSKEFEAAAKKCAVIVNGLHPQYPDWTTELPKISKSTINAARASGATLMFPGNVYNFGAEMPPRLTANTPQIAKTKKGRLRIAMEQEYRTASEQGIQVIVLRCGDFIERKITGTWFDTHLTGNLKKGKFAYPGKHDTKHAWAYLPDAGRALVGLANIRRSLSAFEDIPFEGSTLTAKGIATKISEVVGRKISINNIPWLAIKVLGLFNPMMRELPEMRYLWDVEHELDGIKMAKLLPEFKPTPIHDIMTDILADIDC